MNLDTVVPLVCDNDEYVIGFWRELTFIQSPIKTER